MTRVIPFYSGSSGNCLLVEHGGEKLLIDAGMSCKCITEALRQVDVEIAELSGIFVTHEHSDHIKGLRIITKKFGIPVFATEPVARYLLSKDHIFGDTPVHILEDVLDLSTMRLHPFKTSHDSVGSVGFRISTDNGREIGIATDLGRVTDEVHAALCGCGLVVLESNYDQRMLECGPYPYMLKRRIMSARGHLSNDDCALELERLIGSGCTQFILAHLSKENNLPDLAFQSAVSYLEGREMREGRDYSLHIAPRSFAGRQFVLGEPERVLTGQGLVV
ncbi:MBL fold metallo-hydrolase [Candidatus Soleaferrea massiliensis]|uniref:MBL fold metallo-hydrolase n=1 Tax=Candidatus Soleaferrea massiliensis TaxID=1470354 RepID=UPI0006944CF5|nr:MBL fold metallo-hydrolase [Candidatus Soleaferrea massiliensis]